MTRSSWIVISGIACAGSGLATPLAAQGRPLTITGARNLAFGAVLPGVPRVVARTDPASSGQFDIRGANRGQVLLSFVLPLSMTGPAGALMPLTFGSGDAGYSQSQAIGSQIGFDPKQPFTATLSNNGRGSVFMGATANPPTNQRAGAYTATIVLTVTVLP
jgi:hypothetical protein